MADRTIPLLWFVMAATLICWALAVAGMSRWFGYDTEVIDMPVPALTALLVAAGIAYTTMVATLSLATPPCPRLTGGGITSLRCFFASPSTGVGGDGGGAPLVAKPSPQADRAREVKCAAFFCSPAFALMVAAGLVARLILFASEPILEDDYQRYLWDGAVTADRHNPYAVAPQAVIAGGPAHPLSAVAARSGPVLERIGHGELTTVYPPLAQAAFAAAYWIAPFSLTAWRSVLLAFDLATLGLIVVWLGALGRSPLCAAVYWWNPVVIKELFNAAHMDGLLAPFVLTALLLARNRPLLATAAVGIAFGIKFWPALLLPLIWRPLLCDWRRLALAGLVFAPFAVITLWPQIAAGLDRGAGLVAYAGTWSRNSALYPALETLIGWGVGSAHASLAARGLIGAALVATAVGLAWRPIGSQGDLVGRATLLVGALFLLIPAQYPWYSVWLAPLLALHPIPGALLLPAVLPLYELFFYFASREMADVFTRIIVWGIWIPVWVMLAVDWRRDRFSHPHASLP